MIRRLIEMLFSRHPASAERTEKAREIETLVVKSEVTLRRAERVVPGVRARIRHEAMVAQHRLDGR